MNKPSDIAIRAAREIRFPGADGVHNTSDQKRCSELVQHAIDSALAEQEATISKLVSDITTNDIEFTKLSLESLAKDKEIEQLRQERNAAAAEHKLLQQERTELTGALEGLLESFEAYINVNDIVNADIVEPYSKAIRVITKAKGNADTN